MTATPPNEAPTIRVIAMPSDTNPNGDIFGGWLLSQMDLAGGTIAARASLGRIATVRVEGMTFLAPVSVGDEVSIYAKLLSVGRTSMKIDITAWRRHRAEAESVKVTEGLFIYVAIDEHKQSRPLPETAASHIGMPAV
jgi:acyl-CoA thioesterase YciA